MTKNKIKVLKIGSRKDGKLTRKDYTNAITKHVEERLGREERIRKYKMR